MRLSLTTGRVYPDNRSAVDARLHCHGLQSGPLLPAGKLPGLLHPEEHRHCDGDSRPQGMTSMFSEMLAIHDRHFCHSWLLSCRPCAKYRWLCIVAVRMVLHRCASLGIFRRPTCGRRKDSIWSLIGFSWLQIGSDQQKHASLWDWQSLSGVMDNPSKPV